MLSIAEKCLEEPKHLSAEKRNGWKSREVFNLAEKCSEERRSAQRRRIMLAKETSDQHGRKILGRAEKGSA